MLPTVYFYLPRSCPGPQNWTFCPITVVCLWVLIWLVAGGWEIVTGTVTVSDWGGARTDQSSPAHKLVLTTGTLHHHQPTPWGALGLLAAQTAQSPTYWAAREHQGEPRPHCPPLETGENVNVTGTETCYDLLNHHIIAPAALAEPRREISNEMQLWKLPL